MNQRKLGTVITYIQMILTMVVSLIYTPYMLHILGDSEYGLYNTVASTISLLSILNLGFGSGYIKYYTIYKKNNDTDAIKRLNGLFIKIFTVIGLIALASGLFIAENLSIVFDEGLTADEYNLARVLMIILTINLAISFPMSVFSNIISAHERFVVLKMIGLLKTVCGPLVTIPLLLAGYRSVAIVVVTVLISLTADIIYVFYVLFVLKERFLWSGVEKNLMKELAIYTSFIAINLIIDQINWNIDKLVLARIKGTVAVTVYTVGYTLNTYYIMVSMAVSSVFTPLVHRIVNTFKDDLAEQKRQLTDIFTRVGRVQMLILGLFGTGLILFGREFIAVWVGQETDEAYYVVLILAIPATIPLIQNVGIEIQRAMDKHRFRSIAYSVMAIINLVISIILCNFWGPVGCAIGTGVSMILANGLIMNIYFQKHCNIDICFFWRNIIRILPGILIPFGLFLGGAYFFPIACSYKALIPWILGYSLLYCLCVWFLSMNQYEKNLIRRILKVFSKKRESMN